MKEPTHGGEMSRGEDSRQATEQPRMPDRASAGSDDDRTRLRGFEFLDGYSSSVNRLIDDFYIPALDRSRRYDRAAGYFSSSLLALAPLAFAGFVERGGRMRLLCSPHLTARDMEVFLQDPPPGTDTTAEVAVASLRALVESSDVEASLVACLSSLVHSGHLELQFVVPAIGNGLFHDKVGVLEDVHGDALSFVGSANETGAAWSGYGNHEQFEVFESWRGYDSASRVRRHKLDFDEMWLGLRRGLKLYKADKCREILREISHPEPPTVALQKLRQTLAAAKDTSPAPVKRPLRNYQNQVLDNWASNGNLGIVSFATGGGKTLTAIEAIDRWTAQGLPCLVLVPSRLLHSQWVTELKAVLPSDAAILLAGAGSSKARWMSRLDAYTRSNLDLGRRIVVSTYDTATSADFLERVRGGDHLLVVADEVHNAGAPQNRESLPLLKAGGRLGLSATPERFNDPDGTKAIFDYFGPVLQPVFTIPDAISARVLVPYDYHFATCQLNDDEQLRWDELTIKVSKDIARNDGKLSDYGFLLLQQRARISKSAAQKSVIACEILELNYSPGDRWLVYCATIEHLQEVRAAVRPLKLPVLEYHSSNMPSHTATLDYFTREGGVLLAVKCLDEGIDIPAVNKAIILASSTNPREYVQRRGRVLRKFQGKYSADVFDVLVTESDGAALSMSEVTRAREFASESRNSSATAYLDDLIMRTELNRKPTAVDIDLENTTTNDGDNYA